MKYAVIDLGSNTIRLVVYEETNAEFHALFTQKFTAGLAAYLQDGMMTPEGIRLICTTLQRCKMLLKEFTPCTTLAFSTAPLRNIRNTEEAVEQIRAATGVGVDVISGELEARLGYYGARTATDLQDGAMFDIGGGSAEVLEVRAGEVKKAQSLPIGSLELFNRCVDGLWPKKKELERIRSTVAAALKEARLPAHRAERVCGVGGTARAVLKIANDWYEKPAGNRILTPAEVRRLTKLLLKRDHQARKQILRHCPDRVHTILPGIVLMDALTEALCGGELYISPYGVREGYLCHKLLNAGT